MCSAGDCACAAISNGFAHRCALTAAGVAYCWGWNSYGEVGVPPSDAEPRPVPVSGGLTFRQITTGFTHTCGLTESGAAYCCGGGPESETRGQLANGPSGNSATPIAVVGGL